MVTSSSLAVESLKLGKMIPLVLTIAAKLQKLRLPIEVYVEQGPVLEGIGLPLAVQQNWCFFSHGFTYSEHPVSCAVASRSPFLKLPSRRENPSKKALFSSATLNPSSSDGSLWKRAAELHVGVASQGENASYEMPCLIIAVTDDLDPYPHGNSHLHAGPTPTYIQLHGRPWHANFSGHESLPFISLFFTILGFGK
ncbi:unnamed protein product, partial [Vitis vinifera]